MVNKAHANKRVFCTYPYPEREERPIGGQNAIERDNGLVVFCTLCS